MKNVLCLSEQEYADYRRTYLDIYAATKDIQCFDQLVTRRGYGHYMFKGKVSKELLRVLGRLPTSDEVIMLVDRSFMNFGAACTILEDGTFRGRVNTD